MIRSGTAVLLSRMVLVTSFGGSAAGAVAAITGVLGDVLLRDR